MNRLFAFPEITMSTALTRNFSAGVSGIIKTVHTGFSAYVLHYAAWWQEETGQRYDLNGKICVVF